MRPRVLFLGSTYAGHATRFMNLRAAVEVDERVRPTFRAISGWNEGGIFERMNLVPRGIRGRIRAATGARALATYPRPDAVWTSGREELLPFVWSQLGPLRRPLILDLDATDRQLETMAPSYFGRAPKGGLAARAAVTQEQFIRKAVTLYTPWSNWAADGLRNEGVSPESIRVIPPGVDLERWRPAPRTERGKRLKVLFVGGDFERKGGDLLFEAAVVLADEIELTCVTPYRPPADGPVRFVTASPNSPELMACFAEGELFILPSRAECFGIATIEAMASGLPVIASNVGGTPDIVDNGSTGWLIEPTLEGVVGALRHALANRDQLSLIGARGRARAEALFDGRRNDRCVVDTILEAIEQKNGASHDRERVAHVR